MFGFLFRKPPHGLAVLNFGLEPIEKQAAWSDTARQSVKGQNQNVGIMYRRERGHEWQLPCRAGGLALITPERCNLLMNTTELLATLAVKQPVETDACET